MANGNVDAGRADLRNGLPANAVLTVSMVERPQVHRAGGRSKEILARNRSAWVP